MFFFTFLNLPLSWWTLFFEQGPHSAVLLDLSIHLFWMLSFASVLTSSPFVLSGFCKRFGQCFHCSPCSKIEDWMSKASRNFLFPPFSSLVDSELVEAQRRSALSKRTSTSKLLLSLSPPNPWRRLQVEVRSRGLIQGEGLSFPSKHLQPLTPG